MTSPAPEKESVRPVMSATEAEQQNLCDRCRSIDLDYLSEESPRIVIPVSSLEPECCYCDNFRMMVSECVSGSDMYLLLKIEMLKSERQNPIGLFLSVSENGPTQDRNFLKVMYHYYLAPLKHQRNESRQAVGSCLYDEPAVFSLIQSSLETCRTSHSDCHGRKFSLSVPLKVVDCQSRTLCTIDSDAQYVALSYVWGNVPAQPLLNPQILPLPKTIEDALSICLRVGMKYMWVDRYCIDQGNPPEKHTLISQMDKIYREAEFTIIAAAGESPDYGLPGVNGTPRHRRIEFRTKSTNFVAFSSRNQQVESSTWSKRGWTYQEVILSSRRLYFTDTEIHFECASDWAQENTSEAVGFAYPVMTPTYSWLESGQRFWQIYKLLTEYCKLQLTYSEDAIRGIEAIFQSFQFTYDPRWFFGASEGQQTIKHFYGIPCTSHKRSRNLSFLTSLLWKGFNFRISTDNVQIYPSWSWAIMKTSTQGAMSYPLGELYKGKEDAALPLSITLSHNIRGEESLLDFGAQDDYTSYRPWFQIDSWLLRGRSQQPVTAPWDFSFDKLGTEETLQTDSIVAVNILTERPQQWTALEFLLVDQTAKCDFRRVGCFGLSIREEEWHPGKQLENSPMALVETAAREQQLDMDLHSALALVKAAALKQVQELVPDMEWELQERTVRLV